MKKEKCEWKIWENGFNVGDIILCSFESPISNELWDEFVADSFDLTR